MTGDGRPECRLSGWMHFVLRFAAGYNLLAGFSMIAFYHEGYQWLGVQKPELTLPIQLVGMMVCLLGVGYWMVDRQPLAHRGLLRLGFCSKLIGPLLAIGYIVAGRLPVEMLVVLFFADLVYLVPFCLIDRRIGQMATGDGRQNPDGGDQVAGRPVGRPVA